jgi:hypothetical protein
MMPWSLVRHPMARAVVLAAILWLAFLHFLSAGTPL